MIEEGNKENVKVISMENPNPFFNFQFDFARKKLCDKIRCYQWKIYSVIITSNQQALSLITEGIAQKIPTTILPAFHLFLLWNHEFYFIFLIAPSIYFGLSSSLLLLSSTSINSFDVILLIWWHKIWMKQFITKKIIRKLLTLILLCFLLFTLRHCLVATKTRETVASHLQVLSTSSVGHDKD